VIDGAGAFGNQSVGKTTSCVFSLHATKAFAVGEGGFVASCDANLIGRVRALSNFGFDDSGVITRVGTNAKMSEYHAAIGLAALKQWSRAARRRRFMAAQYIRFLRRLAPRVLVPRGGREWIRPVFVVRLAECADLHCVVRKLAAQKIETRRWFFPPLHEHPAFARCARAGDLPVTRRLSAELLGLPFHPGLRAASMQRVCRALDQALQ
jgi:dTDP-4-amino-4,6-dideoxygalactose transaminase